MGRPVAAWAMTGVAVLVTAFGCGGPVRNTRVVHEDQRNAVRLEAHHGHGQGQGDDGTATQFAHPVVLSDTDWDDLLKAIHVQLRKRLLSISSAQTGPQEAFASMERRYLAPHLAEAFSKARPDEWVVFVLSRQREEGGDLRGGLGVTELTSGGLFVKGGQLHLALANYRYAASMPFIPQQVREDPLRPAGDQLYELVPGRHQAVREAEAIDARWKLTTPLRTRLSELVIEYPALLSRQDVIGDGQSRSEERPSASIEERLRTLQRLREQGLITEEEYRLKRQKLLDEL